MTIETSHESAIMTYGLAKDPRRPWILGLIGVMVLFFLVGGGLFVGLRQPVPIPEDTVLTASLSPATAKRTLSTNTFSSLPVLWHEVLDDSSVWPVLLGAGQVNGSWKHYAIFPRWRFGTVHRLKKITTNTFSVRSYGLVVLVSESSDASHGPSTRYTHDAHWFLDPGWMSFQVIPSELFSSSAIDAWGLGAFRGYVTDKGVFTDLVAEDSSQNLPLQPSDVSLSLPRTTTSSLLSLIGPFMNLGDRPQVFERLPLAQVNLSLGEDHLIQRTQLLFSSALTRDQAREVLASFGLFSKKVIQIEDGTLAVEQSMYDVSHDETLFGQYSTKRFGTIDLRPESLTFGVMNSSTEQVLSSCGAGYVQARFSAAALRQLFYMLNISIPADQLKPVQFRALDKKLFACLEK